MAVGSWQPKDCSTFKFTQVIPMDDGSPRVTHLARRDAEELAPAPPLPLLEPRAEGAMPAAAILRTASITVWGLGWRQYRASTAASAQDRSDVQACLKGFIPLYPSVAPYHSTLLPHPRPSRPPTCCREPCLFPQTPGDHHAAYLAVAPRQDCSSGSSLSTRRSSGGLAVGSW